MISWIITVKTNSRKIDSESLDRRNIDKQDQVNQDSENTGNSDSDQSKARSSSDYQDRVEKQIKGSSGPNTSNANGSAGKAKTRPGSGGSDRKGSGNE